MQIFIDGFSGLVIAEEEESLGEVLSWLERWVRDNQRVIIQVNLEGKSISDDERKKLKDRKIGEFERLELLTSHPWQLAIGSLDEVHQRLPSLAKGLRKVAFLIQTTDCGPAFLLLGDCIDAWKWIVEVLQRVEKMLGLDYSLIFFKGKSLSEKIGDILMILEDTNLSIRNNDLLQLAGLLEYELAPSIQEQRQIVRIICQEVQQRLN